MLRATLRDTFKMDWSQAGGRAGLACLPAIVIALVTGISLGHPGQALIAASGAMSVGFGAFQRLTRSRVGPALVASVGMGISAWVGSLAGHWTATAAITTALWSLACGLLFEFNVGLWWVGLQCCIALIVASARPATAFDSAGRALLIFGGGLLQTGFLVALHPTVPDRAAGLAGNFRQIRFNARSPRLRYALRLATLTGACVVVYHVYSIAQGYWIAMTVLLVYRPDFKQTLSRGLARMIGTIAGAGVATLVAATLRPGLPVLAALVVVFAGLCYTLIYVNYAAYSICITSYVVFLLAIAGLPERTAVKHRLVNTCVAGGISLVSHARFKRRARPPA